MDDFSITGHVEIKILFVIMTRKMLVLITFPQKTKIIHFKEMLKDENFTGFSLRDDRLVVMCRPDSFLILIYHIFQLNNVCKHNALQMVLLCFQIKRFNSIYNMNFFSYFLGVLIYT